MSLLGSTPAKSPPVGPADGPVEDGEEGLRIVLSPVQLAAVLQGRAISQPETFGRRLTNRVFGGLQMIGGAIELITLAQAEKFVSRAIQANAPTIQNWASAARPGQILALPIFDAGEIVGVTIPRATGVLKQVSRVQVVLRKTTIGQKVYFVLTAYPHHL